MMFLHEFESDGFAAAWSWNPVAFVGHDSTTFGQFTTILMENPAVIFKLHPFEMLPASPLTLSTTYNCQIPFGSVFLNIDKTEGELEFPGGAGAGKLNGSAGSPYATTYALTG